jgi:radical SAM-linked protein
MTEVDPTHWEPALARELRKAHRSELVFTPVAPSERLREIRGQALTRADLLRGFEIARRGKWSHIRVQVLLGLPGEEEEDLREWGGLLEDLLTAMKSESSSPKVTMAAVPYAFPRYPADPGRDWSTHLRVVGEWRKRFSRRRLRVVDQLIEQVFTEAASVRGLFPVGQDHGWSRGEADHSRPRSDTDSPPVSDAGDQSSRGFGVPTWVGGRRPKRAARGKEMRQADRFRLRFSKDEPLRFSSHLDVTRAFQRAFRKSQLPVARSGGKDRRLKVSFGPPLPLGMTSGAEFLDVTFQKEVPESFVRSLNQSLVEGLTVVACAPVRTEPDSLNSAIQIASYEVSFSDTVIEDYLGGIGFDDLKIRLEETLTEALASNELLVTKVRGEVSRTFNARPSLRRADVVRDDGGRPALSMQLTLNRPDSVRPELLTATLVNWAKIEERLLRVHRSGLYIPGRNKDLDPLEVVAPGFRWWRQQARRGTVL